ncbi:MAG: tetratricopeptide repeat protein [Bacteroidia bacterium]
MKLLKLVACIILVVLAEMPLTAQQSQVYVAPDAQFRTALDLFEKQKYAEAEQQFDLIWKSSADKQNAIAIDAKYYASLCAMELFHKDAEIRLKEFLTLYPESPKVNKVMYQLGRYNYRKKDFEEALVWFRQVDVYDLRKDELSEFYFKRGYAHYELNHIDSAKKDFFEIKDIDTKYSNAANYYYSHIAYLERNYETALQGFLRLKTDEVFGPVIPYYIAQIYFLQGRYEEVITYAPPLLDSASTKRAPEIAHLIGTSYYRLTKYKEAIPFLEKYHSGVSYLTPQEHYELGYAYYKSDSALKAAEYFEQALNDSLNAFNQNVWYHLADCYIKAGDKFKARDAFGKASSMKFDPVIREDALFNYARLSYELSFSPFNEAIVALNKYLDEYPNTPRRDEAYSLLTNVYLSSKNYKEALQSIEKIKILSVAMQPAYQKIAYNRAVELLNNKDYDGAQKHFDKALVYPVSRELNAMSHYWKAESFYRKAEDSKDTTLYDKAIAEYKLFQVTPGAAILNTFNTSNYNIGYCYFEMRDWDNAVLWFRKYINSKSPADSKDRVYDSYLRLGDGYFRKADFLNAGEFYGKAVDAPSSDNQYKDYALYQQAMAYGYQGKKKEKADLLKKFRENYPNSAYLASSRFQEAKTLHDLRMYDDALAVYNKLYQDLPNSQYAVPCLMNMGLIYRAKNDNDNALIQYRKAVELVKGKGTNEFRDLMREIKDIYVIKGQLDEWESYAESVGFSEETSVADSTTYAVAQRFYKEGNCNEVLKQTNKYIQKYPSGIYITEIHFMRAECAFKAKDENTALGSYNAVLDKGQTKHTLRCLQQISLIYYKQKDWINSIRVLKRLEAESQAAGDQQYARVNLMRCYLFTANMDSAGVYANKVVTIARLENEVLGQAWYIKGKNALNKSDFTDAEKCFKKTEELVPQTDYAAEASYQLCWLKYNAKAYKNAEKALQKHINDYAGHSEWSGRGWLLLADDYLALKDTTRAITVLNFYIANGDVPVLVEQANQKLAVIQAARQNPAERKQQDIILPNGNPDEQKLFENENPSNNGGGQ